MQAPRISWFYQKFGDYHENLDPNWSYTPTYLRKRIKIRKFMRKITKTDLVIDVGCGEGSVVREFRDEGYNIQGVDSNYESDIVIHGDARNLPFDDLSASAVLFLDVFEHIHFADQPKVLSEIYRVLKPGGILFATVPNLAHLNSRVTMALRGNLDRTDSEIEHVGERPLGENLNLFRAANFEIKKISGLTLTLPFIYRRLICRHAAKLRWLHDVMEPLAERLPSLAMITVIECQTSSD